MVDSTQFVDMYPQVRLSMKRMIVQIGHLFLQLKFQLNLMTTSSNSYLYTCMFPYWKKTVLLHLKSMICCIQENHSLLLLLILGRTSTGCQRKNQCPCFFCAELIWDRAMVAAMLLVKTRCISLNCNAQLYFIAKLNFLGAHFLQSFLF